MQTELTVSVAGENYPVSISGDGEFVVNLGVEHGSSQIVRAASYNELVKKARKIKVPFELEFTEVRDNGARNGTVTGIHASNRNLLVRWQDNGKTEQIPGYQGGTAMPRLPAEEYQELENLIRRRNRARDELAAFIKPRAYKSLSEAARNAQSTAAGGDQS
jgi:hypothetical protein